MSYDTRQNGLKRPWFGRVWLNPPYGQFGPAFVRRAVAEFKLGRIEQVIIELSVNHIANGWFSDAMQLEHAICLMRKRIAHYSPVNSVSSAKNARCSSGSASTANVSKSFSARSGKSPLWRDKKTAALSGNRARLKAALCSEPWPLPKSRKNKP